MGIPAFASPPSAPASARARLMRAAFAALRVAFIVFFFVLDAFIVEAFMACCIVFMFCRPVRVRIWINLHKNLNQKGGCACIWMFASTRVSTHTHRRI